MKGPFGRDDPFEALGYQSTNTASEESPLLGNPESISNRIDSPSLGLTRKTQRKHSVEPRETSKPRRQCTHNTQDKPRVNPEKPGYGCAACGGYLDSFTERTSRRLTKIFKFCTGCGVVVKVRAYHG